MSDACQYAVIGAGPAGLQLSYFLQRAGADYMAFERADIPASFFRRYPRHRRLISLNKVHTHSTDPEIRLRWDWNSLLNDSPELQFPRFSEEYLPHADDLVRYLTEFQHRHRLRVRYGTAVRRVERDGTGFAVHTSRGTLRCRCVVVATGWGRPHVPRIPGIGYATGYEDLAADPRAFTNKRVLIIGKGNSAFETASSILDRAAMVHLASRRPLRLAWNSKHPGDVRGQYGTILDSYQFKTLHSVLDCTIDEIRPAGNHFDVHITYSHADGERAVLAYDAIIRCTGFAVDTAMFGPDCQPELSREGRIPALRPDWQSTNVDGLYFAGTIAQDRDFRRASSAFIDGFRYNLRTLTALLCERYGGIPLAHDVLPAEPAPLAAAILDRLNWSSALWTQFEYLCDVLVVDAVAGRVRRYSDLPEDYAVERFGREPHYYTVSLRWGRNDHPDVFAIDRHPEPGRAAESAFIHPVIRRYRGRELVGEQHLLEDLLAQWRCQHRHVAPLRAFIEADLAG